jgi:3-oxoacyl-[acyl-carrier protein] reductase
VLVHYCSAEKEAAAVVAEIRACGGNADKVAADLRTPDGPHRLARRVRVVIGARLDVLVTSAHVSKTASIEDTTVGDFNDLFAVNVRAPYFLVQQLMPTMCKGSSIILVSPVAAHASSGTLSAYAATAGAIDTFVMHLASTLGARGVRVNAIAPGVVETDRSSFEKIASGRELRPGTQALKHVGTPDDIGAATVFLASDAARWITGDTLHVDGGSKR